MSDLEERRVAALEKMAAAQQKRADIMERQLALHESESGDRKILMQGCIQVLGGVVGYLNAIGEAETRRVDILDRAYRPAELGAASGD